MIQPYPTISNHPHRYSCENNYTVNTMLKGWLGFRGWQLSDYKGTRSTVNAANHGHDMQMPGCKTPDKTDPLTCSSDTSRPNFFGEPLEIAVQNGSVTTATIDEKVRDPVTDKKIRSSN
jgi:beta-glucosidase